MIPPRSPFASSADVRPGLEPLFERWRRNFIGLGAHNLFLRLHVLVDLSDPRRTVAAVPFGVITA